MSINMINLFHLNAPSTPDPPLNASPSAWLLFSEEMSYSKISGMEKISYSRSIYP